MKLLLSEIGMRAAGYRKPGLKTMSPLPEPRQIIINRFTKEEKEIKYENDFCLSGNTETCQLQTSACGCATPCAMCEDFIIRTKHDKSVGIRWREAWDHMKNLGWASEEEGSFLADAIYFAQTIGYMDNYGRTWVIDKLEKISKLNIEDYLRAGIEIYTGALVGFPMTDKNFLFKTGGQYGHAFRLIGIENEKILAETTWKNYGARKESQFYLDKPGVNSLFSCYAINFKLLQ